MKLEIFQVDAFTNKTFGGNPAAVVPLDAWLPDDVMLSIAAENNLAETAFFVRNGDVYEIVWFTPTCEIELCGHATLASSYVIFEELGHDSETIRFTTRTRGDLSVTKADGRYVLDFPAYPMRSIEPIAELTAAENAPLEYFESQGNMLFLVLDSERTVRELTPNFRLIEQLSYREVIVTAKGDTCDFASRMFAPKIGIPEDPVTGAIHCSLIPFWAERLGNTKLFARQVSARGGELFCEHVDDRVKIGGNAVLYLKGEIYVEAAGEKCVAA
ncbi:MAG: PhzF family phenazine biosynthesis protein [Pyrinomonadaceae bacterium]